MHPAVASQHEPRLLFGSKAVSARYSGQLLRSLKVSYCEIICRHVIPEFFARWFPFKEFGSRGQTGD